MGVETCFASVDQFIMLWDFEPILSKKTDLGFDVVPSNTTLDTRMLRAEFGLEPPDVQSTIDLVLGQIEESLRL